MKANEIKQEILKNYKEWLLEMNGNIEDYPNSLDIADSGNQADFRDTMFNNTGFEISWSEFDEQMNEYK